jgi:hypothetical protein
MKEKIIQKLNSLKQALSPKLLVLDSKFQSLIPNPKLRKILYISILGLFGFMFLLIMLGIILSPFRNKNVSNGLTLTKPKIVISSPEPIKELNETQKELLNIENKIKDLRFPESILTIPTFEKNLTI